MAKNAGADCIEIHGHVGYLLDQFMTTLWNHRDDEYGAQNFENKMRLTTEIYHACRDAAGPDMPILFRSSITFPADVPKKNPPRSSVIWISLESTHLT